jgi:rhamnosyltransferase
MILSIIIPTYNAAGSLPDLLEKIKTQTAAYHEIIVIDSSSKDNTIEIAESLGAQTIIVPKEEFDHGMTRNKAAVKAKGEILVFLTQDAIPADEFSLQNLIRPFSKDENVAAVYGRQLPASDASLFSEHLRLFNYPKGSYTRSIEDKRVYGFKTIFFSDSFSAYKRSELEKIGWFKGGLIFGEDTLAVAKLLGSGHKIAYAADAVVYHSHNYTASQEFKRYFDIGVLHSTENWMIREFGNIKGEGKKYLISEASYIIKCKKYYLMPFFIMRNILKYTGYNLGRRYSLLPGWLACRISMNSNWWVKRLGIH